MTPLSLLAIPERVDMEGMRLGEITLERLRHTSQHKSFGL